MGVLPADNALLCTPTPPLSADCSSALSRDVEKPVKSGEGYDGRPMYRRRPDGPVRHGDDHGSTRPVDLLESRRCLPVPDSGDEMNTIEGATLGDGLGQVARELHASVLVVLDGVEP
jgi:hypothetical protein